MKILIVEDNEKIRTLLKDYLESIGYQVSACIDGIDGYDHFLQDDYNLALLDIMMPGMDGFELCEKIKQLKDIPVIFLTAKVLEEDQLKAYALGCDDYIIKPFSLPILGAKIQAVLKRHYHPIVEYGPFKLDQSNQIIYLENQSLDLLLLDYKLLAYLIIHHEQLLSREIILNHVFGYDYEGSNRSVDTHIKNLRKKLGSYQSCIQTVMKKGYRFEIKG